MQKVSTNRPSNYTLDLEKFIFAVSRKTVEEYCDDLLEEWREKKMKEGVAENETKIH